MVRVAHRLVPPMPAVRSAQGSSTPLSRVKCFKIMRDDRSAARTLANAASGIANLHSVILAD